MVIPLRDRILGRVVVGDVLNPGDGSVIVADGELIDEAGVEEIENSNISQVNTRSPVACETRYGICAKCYGRDLGRGHLVNRGEAVGVIAAQSIGEPGTQLTMRTFHIGGAASRVATASNVEVKTTGKALLNNIKVVKNSEGKNIVVTRSCELIIQDLHGADRERYKLPYGAMLNIGNGDSVEVGQIVAEWDPHTHPIITDVAGKVVFTDLVDGVTVHKQTDEYTGLSTLVVMDAKTRRGSAQDIKPMITLVDADGKELCIGNTEIPVRYLMPAGSIIMVGDGDQLNAGDVLARIPQESSKTRDITGGLPRVAELFEARKPKDPAFLAAVSGIVSFGKETKGKQRLVITDKDGESHEFLISKERTINVFEGETVEKGEMIIDGAPIASDILELLGVQALSEYIVNEVQDVYRLQGVRINDKHIEVIIRQMLRKVRIIDPGDTLLLPGEQIERSRMLEENERMLEEEKEPAVYARVLLGITKASLTTDSFISAASFQETTRVLTEASINGKVDSLRGLKENVIVGRLIPAGTGLAYHEERHRKRQESVDKAVELQELLSTTTVAEASEQSAEPDQATAEPGDEAAANV